MSKEVGHYSRRFVVEVGAMAWADITPVYSEPTYTRWSFHRAFNREYEAASYADRIAEHHEFVRVIDRGEVS